MVKVGKPPYLECSTKGDKRFSALCAYPPHGDGWSIEEVYQANKILEDGSTGLPWREAKGKKAINQEQCNELYRLLWQDYLDANPDLVEFLLEQSGLSDCFAKPGSTNQAEVLWSLLEEYRV